jgi:transcriptional regulator with XRE-family HTH domain
MTITSAQVKEARKLLGWTQIGLAVRAPVSYVRFMKYENGRLPLGRETIDAIQRALEAAGVEFIAGEPGVKLRKAE